MEVETAQDMPYDGMHLADAVQGVMGIMTEHGWTKARTDMTKSDLVNLQEWLDSFYGLGSSAGFNGNYAEMGVNMVITLNSARVFLTTCTNCMASKKQSTVMPIDIDHTTPITPPTKVVSLAISKEVEMRDRTKGSKSKGKA